jgi:hypothetical protein
MYNINQDRSPERKKGDKACMEKWLMASEDPDEEPRGREDEEDGPVVEKS